MTQYRTEQIVHKTGLSRRRLQPWVHNGILRAEIPGIGPQRWKLNGLSLARLRLMAGLLQDDVHQLEDHDWAIVSNRDTADLGSLHRPSLAIWTGRPPAEPLPGIGVVSKSGWHLREELPV